MKFAYIMSDTPGGIDLMLEHIADQLIASGQKLAGIVQTNTEREKGHKCDMDVRVLPGGPVLRISQDLGAASKGCRLNPDVLERAVVAVDQSITPDTDLLVINKFGKHETEGRGFCNTIALAVEQGVPVLVGVNGLNLDAFLAYSGGLAVKLDNVETALAWAEGDSGYQDFAA